MSITEPRRLGLHAAARAALGDEEGDTLMSALPPANTDIATRQDMELLAATSRTDLERVETALRTDIERVDAALRADMKRLETSLRTDLRRVETGLRTDIERVDAALRADMRRLDDRFEPLEERMSARITAACNGLRDELTTRIHRSELRTIAAVALAFIADRALG